ncbi:hypothetical protein NKJ46_33985, partial [Mesorhizobium sp. M0166]|uniref:hypothetical protein n=1 Tax=Mesorhizobium sp. M0166 TaxID=2956902 RepID=UPI003335E58B
RQWLAKQRYRGAHALELPALNGISYALTNGPWDDLLLYRFRCTTCAQVFLLSAETYHGSGGEWAKEAG